MTSRDSDTVIKNLPGPLHSHKNTSNQWKQVKLGELLGDNFQNGIYKPSSAYGSGVPIIRINNFDNEGNFVSLKFQRLSIKKSEIEGFKVQENDILINRVNSLSHIGKSIIVKNISEPTVYESNMMRLRITNNELLPDFLACLLQTSQARNHFRTVAKKAVAQASINQTDVKSLEFLLPPLPEQRKIAEILSTWDQAITLTEQLIAAKQRRKKALMQQLLTGRRRFWEFEGEWREASLEEFSDIFFSNVDKIIDPKETPVKLCNYMDVYKNFYLTNGLQFKMGSASKNELEKFSLFKNDVIITKDSETPEDIAHAAVVIEDLKNTVCGYHLAIIRPNKQEVDGVFLMHYLNYPMVNNQFARLANGITRFGLTTNAIKHANVRLPSLPEQCKIASVLQACDEEIELLKQKLAALKRQKQGLMQQLLTGRVRVKPSP